MEICYVKCLKGKFLLECEIYKMSLSKKCSKAIFEGNVRSKASMIKSC